MKKVDWSFAPKWATYAAMNGDGSWWFFSHKPRYRKEDKSWGHSDWGDNSERVEEFLDRAHESLEERPSENLIEGNWE